MNGWTYYNYAAVPVCAPHEKPDETPVKDGSVWTLNDKKPLLARWITDFDCGYETEWWYVIKDTPFDINKLKSKRRYEINKGVKNFEIRKITNVSLYSESFYSITKNAFEGYPAKYKPEINHDNYIAEVKKWGNSNYDLYGAFSRENNELVAFAKLKKGNGCIDFEVLKAIRQHEKNGVNAALVYGILQDYNEKILQGTYICDGTRSIIHETAFQDYLEKYFGFRKAYGVLNIVYRPSICWLIKILFLFRKILLRLDGIPIIHKLNAILKMEEILRRQNKLQRP